MKIAGELSQGATWGQTQALQPFDPDKRQGPRDAEERDRHYESCKAWSQSELDEEQNGREQQDNQSEERCRERPVRRPIETATD